MNHNNDQHGTTIEECIRSWYMQLGCNHLLYNLIVYPLNKRESISGTGNLTNYSELVNS